MSYQN